VNNSAPVWVIILVAILGSTALSSVVSVIASRRKLGAETGALSATATETITKAAAGVLKEARDDNARLRDEIRAERAKSAELEARVDVLEQRDLDFRRYIEDERRTLQLHAAWDVMATTAVNQAIPPIDLPSPPPLTPPTRPPGFEG
jgi:uncharacterized protein YlxW (UPF0749 family)